MKIDAVQAFEFSEHVYGGVASFLGDFSLVYDVMKRGFREPVWQK